MGTRRRPKAQNRKTLLQKLRRSLERGDAQTTMRLFGHSPQSERLASGNSMYLGLSHCSLQMSEGHSGKE